MDTFKRTTLMHAVAKLLEDHKPSDVFDICMTIIAINDVLNGCPDYALACGKEKLMGEVYYASLVTEDFMERNNRVPTMAEVIDARRCDIERKRRTRFSLQLN